MGMVLVPKSYQKRVQVKVRHLHLRRGSAAAAPAPASQRHCCRCPQGTLSEKLSLVSLAGGSA